MDILPGILIYILSSSSSNSSSTDDNTSPNNAKNTTTATYNILNSHPTTWSRILPDILSSLQKSPKPDNFETQQKNPNEVRIVEYKVWLSELEKAAEKCGEEDLEGLPAVKLLNFYRDLVLGAGKDGEERSDGGCEKEDVKEEGEEGDEVVFCSENAKAASARMRELEPVNAEWLVGWVEQWREWAC